MAKPGAPSACFGGQNSGSLNIVFLFSSARVLRPVYHLSFKATNFPSLNFWPKTPGGRIWSALYTGRTHFEGVTTLRSVSRTWVGTMRLALISAANSAAKDASALVHFETQGAWRWASVPELSYSNEVRFPSGRPNNEDVEIRERRLYGGSPRLSGWMRA